jgi:hypothetical protein
MNIVAGWMIAFCFWFIQVKLPTLGQDQEQVNRKIARLKRKRDREALGAVGREPRRKF